MYLFAKLWGMFKTYFLVALRVLQRNKAFSFLNILGLAVGVAASLLIFLVIRHEKSYDDYHSKKDRIYRVVTTMVNRSNGEIASQRGTVPLGLDEVLRTDVPGLERTAVAFKANEGSQVYIRDAGAAEERKFLQRDCYFVQPELFDIFDFTWLDGNAADLKHPGTVVLAENVANRFFGDWRKAMGKTIQLWSWRFPLRVCGVFKDLPANTDLSLQMGPSAVTFKDRNPEIYTSASKWHFSVAGSDVFVLLRPGASAVAGVEKSLDGIVKKYYGEDRAEYLTRTR